MRSQGLWESLREAVLSAATHPSLFSLVTSLYAVPTWSEREEKVKWRTTKNWEDSEQYAHHKTIANQQWFPQHPNSWFATTRQGGHVGRQNNRIFSRRIFMKKEFSSQRSKALNIFKNHCQFDKLYRTLKSVPSHKQLRRNNGFQKKLWLPIDVWTLDEKPFLMLGI